jgi:hypothetical protein
LKESAPDEELLRMGNSWTCILAREAAFQMVREAIIAVNEAGQALPERSPE